MAACSEPAAMLRDAGHASRARLLSMRHHEIVRITENSRVAELDPARRDLAGCAGGLRGTGAGAEGGYAQLVQERIAVADLGGRQAGFLRQAGPHGQEYLHAQL